MALITTFANKSVTLPEKDGTLIWGLAVPSPPSLTAQTSMM